MKTWKQGFIGIMAVIALSFTACDDGKKDDPEQPEYRETTITLNWSYYNSNAQDTISVEYNIKVSGTLLATEWNGVPGMVESVLEAAYPANPLTFDELMFQGSMDAVFARTGANVSVEKTEAYPHYKIIGDGITLCLRFSVLNSISTDIIREACRKMEGNETHSN